MTPNEGSGVGGTNGEGCKRSAINFRIAVGDRDVRKRGVASVVNREGIADGVACVGAAIAVGISDGSNFLDQRDGGLLGQSRIGWCCAIDIIAV